jgi:hypothetical protein
MRTILAVSACAAMLAAGAVPARAQASLDRLLSRVNGVAITASDVSQARTLKLVADTSSDEACQRELENRILVLGEVSRGAALDSIDDAAVAEHRRSWEASLGAPADQLMSRADMSERALQAWLRDDLRIRAFLQRQFGGRPGAVSDWIARLRERAGLR